MLMLSAAEVRQCLPMREAIEGLRHAFAALEQGQTLQPLRTHLAMPDTADISLFMPAYLDMGPRRHAAVKVVSVYPSNPARGLPVIHGLVLLLDPETGRILASMEGGALTAIRTGAVSGLATDLLAPATARTVAIFGAGVQARTQLEAVCAVRPVESVQVYAPSPAHVQRFITDMRSRLPESAILQAAASPQAALTDCDIICTATSSAVPVLDDRDVKAGMHINAVGVFEPGKQEIPAATVMRARTYIDDWDAALDEAGDILVPLQAGQIEHSHIAGTLGALVTGKCPGRRQPSDITLFKSVGVAIQDAAAAGIAYDNARTLQIGREISL